MPKFVITTHSTFENRYLIDAENVAEAIKFVESSNDSLSGIDFYQKHINERAVSTEEVKEGYPMHSISHDMGYY